MKLIEKNDGKIDYLLIRTAIMTIPSVVPMDK
jgi:hypothetical protein